jgi:hypothetical protein
MQSIENAIDEFAASDSGQSPSHRPVSPIECFADAAAVDALETNDEDSLLASPRGQDPDRLGSVERLPSAKLLASHRSTLSILADQGT